MKVGELLALLNDLTIGDLDKEVYIEVGKDELVDFDITPITESCDDDTIVGFMISEKEEETDEDDGEPTQLNLPFDEPEPEEEKREVH